MSKSRLIWPDGARPSKRKFFRPRHPFLWTTAALFALMLFLPLAESRILTFLSIQLIFLDALLVGITAGGVQYGKMARFLLLTWLATVALESASFMTRSSSLESVFQLSASLIFFGFIIACLVVMLLYILRSKKVTTECLFAAASAYLLIGLTFGILYQAIAVLNPDAFAGLKGSDSGVGGDQVLELIYFSLVTLTTLGYGDITAVSAFARMVSALEAVVGQLYIALLVGWLIGTFVSGRMDRSRGAG